MNKLKVDQLAHLIAGFIIFIQVFNWFEKVDPSFTLFYLLAGCFFLILAGVHKWVEKHFIRGEIAFFLLEAASFVFAGWHIKEEGGSYMWMVFTALGAVYILLAVYTVSMLLQSERRHESSRSRRRHSRPRKRSFSKA